MVTKNHMCVYVINAIGRCFFFIFKSTQREITKKHKACNKIYSIQASGWLP